MGGIIVIDFIDMESPKRKAEVLRVLTEALKNDRSKPAIFEITGDEVFTADINDPTVVNRQRQRSNSRSRLSPEDFSRTAPDRYQGGGACFAFFSSGAGRSLRDFLSIGQGDTVKHLFPMIAKLRFYPYKKAASAELDALVKKLLP